MPMLTYSDAPASPTAAPVRAVTAPIKPPHGAMFDYVLTDAGVVIIYDPDVLDRRNAIELVALVTGLRLTDIDAEVTL